MTRTGHGTYAAYSNKPGCRCDECRKAKAEYMRERRAEAREVAQKYSEPNPRAKGARRVGALRYVANIDSHGTRFGYEEHGCRCLECTDARGDSDRRYRKAGA